MITRLRKLPIFALCAILLALLSATFIIWNHSELKTRVLHGCISEKTSLEDCYIAYYRDISDQRGTKFALEQLHDRQTTDSRLSANCHQAIHSIGRAAFREYGSIAKAYAQADYSCWGGYLHGVVEASMRGKVLSDIAGDTLRTMCDSVKEGGETSFAHFSCIHGLGHALMYVGHNDLPAVLTHCDDLVDVWEIRQCANGAFMENTLADSAHPSNFQPKDDAHFPCNIVREDERDVCYQVQSPFIMEQMKGDFTKAFAFCDELSVNAERTLCVQGLGAEVSTYMSHDPKKIAQLCAAVPPPSDRDCFYGALTDLEGVDGGPGLGRVVCQNLTGEAQVRCLQILDKAHKAFPGAMSSADLKK